MSLWRRLGGAVARRRLAAGLDGVWVDGLDRAREALAAGPVVFAATHVAWWDGLVLMALDAELGERGAAWMDADNLDRLPFFGRLGAVPVHPGRPGKLRDDVRVSVAALSGPGASLWVFPQGRQRPSWLRPLGVRRGAEVVARRAGASLVPVALAYAHRDAPVPAAFVHFGEPHANGLEAGLVAGLAAIDAELERPVPTFAPLVPSRVARPDHSLATRLLAVVSRG